MSHYTLPLPGFKFCNICKRLLPETHEFFHKGTGNKNGLRPLCRECRSKQYADNPDRLTASRDNYQRHKNAIQQRNKRYKRMHPEKVAEWQKRYSKKTPHKTRAIKWRRRARQYELPAEFTDKNWIDCLEAFSYCCAYCGNQQGLLPHTKLTADHFIPIASLDCPGTVKTNMLPACSHCNQSKNDSAPLEWLIWKFGARKARKILARIEAYFKEVLI